jgi:hypothetical protein
MSTRICPKQARVNRGPQSNVKLVQAIAVMGCFAAAGRAETCPWLNAATAAGVLGSSVTATVSHENANHEDAACSFGVKGSELKISVQTMDTPRSEFTAHAAECGPNASPLKAIGNEAVVCEPESSPGTRSARVVGRVRNRIFTILITTADSSTAMSVLREKARGVAEQVAGFLF